jgi:hypothetical protein
VATKQELSQLRFIASSSRPLVREKDTTALSALDLLEKLGKRWDWLWLAILCMDGDQVTAEEPIADTLAHINSHGGPVGIVGAVMIDRSFHFLRKPLVKGNRVRTLVNASAKKTEDQTWEAVRKNIRSVFLP